METLHTWWATELYPMRERDQFGVSGEFEVALAADAQATIAALQARVQELEAIKTPDDAFTYCAYCGEKSPVDEHNEDLAAHIKICPKHPMRDVESQLTQRTVELHETQNHLADADNEVEQLRKQLSERTAELEAANTLLYKKNCALGRAETSINNLQAELERVRGELAETKEEVKCLDEQVSALNQGCLEYERLIAALPKVEGEINERFCTGSYYSSPHDYRSHVTFETALVALLKHRQGMEG